MKTVPAKTILSAYQPNGWFGTDYTMNLYRGCCHGCIYCDSRSECYHVEQFDTVTAKENALELLERDLRAKRKTGVIMTGSMSDPYNPFEKGEELTRGALKLIQKYGFGVAVITKSDLVTRDIDLFSKISRQAPVFVHCTITTLDDQLCRKLEPRVAPTSRRLEALKALSDAGVTAGVLLTPILPYLNDTEENVGGIVRQAGNAGAKYIYSGGYRRFGVTLRQNQREYYYQQLDRLFPGLRESYQRQYGNAYECNSLNSANLWQVFERECISRGIPYRMKDITALVHAGHQTEQLRLFE